MKENFHSLIPEIKRRIEDECLRETLEDTEELIGLPYPYVIPGKGKREAQYYWDSYFINLGLLRLKLTDLARHGVENLIYLVRKFGYVPASNHRDHLSHSHPPFLPWMVRDVYRATGDKEWLRRILPEVLQEFRFWTNKPHTTPSGLYRYHAAKETDKWPPERAAMAESGWIDSPRFDDARQYNAVDLNALMLRNARIIFDLSLEATGQGDENILQKVAHLKKSLDHCWDQNQGFYFDYHTTSAQLSTVKSLAGYMPLFTELVDEKRARSMQQHLVEFASPGGLCCTIKEQRKINSLWSAPISQAPYIYFTLKGLCDYDMMEDAADMGTNWLAMVKEIYEQTGEMWAWYNVQDRTPLHPEGIENTPLLGWTAGVYIAIVDTLGLE